MLKKQQWVGRFAPSPSGPLHFGSLVAALGSYLIAKQKQGEWLVRIEDLDPPREVAGAAVDILKTLEIFGFEWDREITYQSQGSHYYLEALNFLESQGFTYQCNCSRKQILQRNHGIYDSFCLKRSLTSAKNSAIRIKFSHVFEQFNRFDDGILGACELNQPEDKQDFVIKRRDGLFAYQLAVVVDDLKQGVNHIVRGADILDSTPRQNYLYQCFNQSPPLYFHLPLVMNKQGDKLSKSKLSPAIQSHQASLWLIKALQHLEQRIEPSWHNARPDEILASAVQNWSTYKVGKVAKQYDELS